MAVNDNRPYTPTLKELYEEQVHHGHDAYVRADLTGGARNDGGVVDNHDDRVATANAAHAPVANADLVNVNQEEGFGGVPVYTGGNIVNVAPNRAGVDVMPEDAQAVEDLEHEVLVEDALAADALYTTGGPVGDYTGPGSLSDTVDGTWLAEASKQTGEKFF